MDILLRLLGHDAWTGHQLLSRCLELSDEQLDQPFDVGLGSVRATLRHTVGNIEVWTALMVDGPIPEREGADDHPPSAAELLRRHDAAMAGFRALAERIAAEGRLDDLWIDRLDDPPREKTYGGAIAHVLTHDHFHRAELLHMLARLGLAGLPEGDVLSWEQQTRTPTTT
ncbi:MAG: DinB family protein [Dehalococcoidia bacterium]